MHISIHVELGTPSAAPRRRWRRFSAAALALALILPMVTLASDSFADVPDSNPFHTDISRVYAARVAAGCGSGNYCPSSAVTREQMAAFLNRVGSRAAYDPYSGEPIVTSADVELATLTIRAGNVLGGTAFVKVDAISTAYITSTTGCPCQTRIWIQHVGGSQSTNTYTQLATLASSGYGLDTASTTGVFSVPTGVDQTFKLMADIFGGTGTVSAWGEMSAIYAPFGNMGGSTVTTTAVSPDTVSAPLPR